MVLWVSQTLRNASWQEPARRLRGFFFLTFPVIKTLVCLHINFLHCVFVIVSPALETLALC